MKIEHTVAFTAGMVVSVFLHLAAVIWWVNRPVVGPVAVGQAAVTVDLVTPNLLPFAPPVQPVIPPPPPVQQPEPEVLKDDEMAVQRKIVKKKPKPKVESSPVPQAQPPQPVQQQAAAPPVAAAAQAQQSSTTEARFDANYLSAPATYPSLSQRLGEEGRVLLRVEVSADGRPLTVTLKTSSGFVRLDEAAIKAVTRWQFKPAQQNGRAVASRVDVPILFKLKKRSEDR